MRSWVNRKNLAFKLAVEVEAEVHQLEPMKPLHRRDIYEKLAEHFTLLAKAQMVRGWTRRQPAPPIAASDR